MEDNSSKKVSIPRFSSDSGFIFKNKERERLEFVSLPKYLLNEGGNYGATIINGNGMIKEGLHDGDMVVIDHESEIQNGDIGTFYLPNGEYVLKKYFFDTETNRHILQFCDDVTPPIIVDANEKNFKKIGKMVLSICKR